MGLSYQTVPQIISAQKVSGLSPSSHSQMDLVYFQANITAFVNIGLESIPYDSCVRSHMADPMNSLTYPVLRTLFSRVCCNVQELSLPLTYYQANLNLAI